MPAHTYIIFTASIQIQIGHMEDESNGSSRYHDNRYLTRKRLPVLFCYLSLTKSVAQTFIISATK